ncbi:MAG: radical SAM protein, partial [Candidatus Omnitrophota bacterium]
MKKKISLINLGCPRNLVDAELMLGALSQDENYLITDEIEGSDLVIINTCVFVESAKNENIEVILKAVDLKNNGDLGSIIVAGCFGQRYTEELKQEIPEIDAVLGIDSFCHIEEAVKAVLAGGKFSRRGSTDVLYPDKQPRMLTTPAHYTYLKIAEGCRNYCSYCIINKIRGGLRSRSMEAVLEEFESLSNGGKLSEINIIAQDTTSYGVDIYNESKLAQLLSRMSALDNVHWIRLLYTHPAYFTDELIRVIAENQAICRYIDLP